MLFIPLLATGPVARKRRLAGNVEWGLRLYCIRVAFITVMAE